MYTVYINIYTHIYKYNTYSEFERSGEININILQNIIITGQM